MRGLANLLGDADLPGFRGLGFKVSVFKGLTL